MLETYLTVGFTTTHLLLLFPTMIPSYFQSKLFIKNQNLSNGQTCNTCLLNITHFSDPNLWVFLQTICHNKTEPQYCCTPLCQTHRNHALYLFSVPSSFSICQTNFFRKPWTKAHTYHWFSDITKLPSNKLLEPVKTFMCTFWVSFCLWL